MKKLLIIISACFYFSSIAEAQEFSFQMNFIDAIGNTDSITIGYDINGTDTIDGLFGENNIIGIPLDTGLDVRITNEWYNRNFLITPGTIHTKKQIIHNECGNWFSVQGIDIRTTHWPVTATWNNSLFNDTCRNGSVFTGIPPGGWWDVSCPSDLYRKELLFYNSATFTTNTTSSFNPAYVYVNNGGDTIPVFWQTFGDSTLLTLSTNDILNVKQKLEVFPNPTTEKISLKVPKQFGKLISVEIFSSLGQLTLKTKITADLNLSFLEKGIYLIVVTNESGEKLLARMLKE